MLAVLYPEPTGFKGISDIFLSQVPAGFSPDGDAGAPREVNPTHPGLLCSVQPQKKKVWKVPTFRLSSLQ